MGDKDSDKHSDYRIMLQIEDVANGVTYGPEPIELFKTDDENEAVEKLEEFLEALNFFGEFTSNVL